jgi:hypothetical protein
MYRSLPDNQLTRPFLGGESTSLLFEENSLPESPDSLLGFRIPCSLSRELSEKPQRERGISGAQSTLRKLKSPKFPVFSLVAGNFGPRDGFAPDSVIHQTVVETRSASRKSSTFTVTQQTARQVINWKIAMMLRAGNAGKRTYRCLPL